MAFLYMRSYGVIEKSLDNFYLVFREKKRFHKIKTAYTILDDLL